MDETRFIDIETKLAFQEDTIQQLHDALCAQQQRIERLELTCKLLLDRLKEMSQDDAGPKTLHEKPPHY